ncbi:carrier protein, variant [Capsaspora owczarzaki ATCC 30864]|nr:carrier protein, variant [Capsaspora owczarzaki ATCC 30864]|eukprot:XP_011270317.1 carrier protein, variant [Capsaspora owczarzaki ATCC 30864]
MQVHTKPVSALTVFREVIAQNGVTGIFKGLGPPLAASAFVTSALFGSYSAVLAQLHTHPVIHEHSFLQLNVHNAIAGAGGGLAQAFLTCPIDVVKNRLQIEGMGHGDGGHGHAHGGGGSAFKLARHIVSSHGLRGLYLGFGPTLMRDVPGYAVFFASYESLKHLMLGDAKRGDDAEPDGGEHAGGPLAVIVAGGTAGSLYHLSTYPFDVVKTAIQTQPDTYPRMYKNTFDCYKQLVAQYGHGALIRGIGPTMVRAFPANAAGFLAYELTLRLLP